MVVNTEGILQAWRKISKEVLTPQHPFNVHQKMFAETYKEWPQDVLGPPPVWVPSEEEMAGTNLAEFMEFFDDDLVWLRERTGDLRKDLLLLHKVSCQNEEAYWGAVLRRARIAFAKAPYRILREHANPDMCQWLPGAKMNIAACALNSAWAPSQDSAAIVWAPQAHPTTLIAWSWTELKGQVYHRAACLRLHFAPGDPIAICMAMGGKAVAWYLAIVLSGCVAVSIADSFAPDEMATRLRIAKAKGVVTQDVILRGGKAHALYSKLVEAGAPSMIVLSAHDGQPPSVRIRPSDMDEQHLLAKAGMPVVPVEHVCDAEATTNIIFSSGTTGEPKAIPWTHITPLKCMADAWAHQDVKPGDVVCWPTNMGWMMGPWVLYGALLNGATMAIYEGSPLGAEFGEFVQAAKVTMLGVVPSMVKTWRQSNCMKNVDWSCVKCCSSTGEASAPEDYHWLSALAGYKPIIEYCGGTELGGSYLTGTLLQPQCPSTFSLPCMGTALTLLEPDGKQSSHLEGCPATGEVALVSPLFGSSQRLLNRDHFKTYYHEMPADPDTGRPLRRHGDELQRLPGGYYVALGRCDDTMNLGGIKVASVELERVVTSEVAEVVEAAAVGVPTPGGGPELLFLFLVLGGNGAAGKSSTQQLKQRCQTAIRQHLNPLFKVSVVEVCDILPRNTSGKVMRRLLRDEVLARPARSRM